MSEIVDIAYKFGGGRYFQGKNVLEQLGKELKRFGSKAYIVGGPTALSIAKNRIIDSLQNESVEYFVKEYSGFCCYSEAEKVKEEIRLNECDVIIGVGGGRIMDFSKLCGDYAKIPVITVPTSMSTCAAYTTLSVIYDENGKTVGNYYLRTEVSAIFVDADIMANQPIRLVAAGVMDALAKYIEIKNGHPEVNSDNFDIDLMTAAVLAEHTYNKILDNWEQACESINNHTYSDSMNNLIFLCIPITGMISGISKGFGQSALAHELYYQLRTNFTKEALGYLHGEVVAIGLLTQLYYNQTPELVAKFKRIMSDMHMPTNLPEIGVQNTNENFHLIYNNMIASPFVKNNKLFENALKVIF